MTLLYLILTYGIIKGIIKKRRVFKMIENGEMIVCKSNELIQKSKFSLNRAEIQIVNYMIAQIDSPRYDINFNRIRFEVKEFYNLLGVENIAGSAYNYLKNTIQKLADKSMWIPLDGGKETLIRWIEKPIIDKHSGCIEIKLDDDLKPYLLNMNGYIKAQLSYSFQMTSKYSIRLYELLKSWEGSKNGIKKFEIDELKKQIDATQKSYNNFAKFNQTVLTIAVREINDITDLHTSYTVIKSGRKVTYIEFTIKKKAKKKSEEAEQLPGQMGIYDYPDIVPEGEPEQTAEELYVQRVNNEAFNGEFTAEKAAYLIEIGKVRAQERVSEENLFDADAANAEKINYYREKYLQMRAGSTSKTVAGRAKYLEKILIAERDAGDELPAPAIHKKSKNKFNNFHQREYNIGELEQQLLNSQK